MSANKLWLFYFICCNEIIFMLINCHVPELKEPSISCLLFGDKGCEWKCQIKCSWHECKKYKAHCDWLYCDCNEIYDNPKKSTYNSISDVLESKFEKNDPLEWLKSKLISNPELESRVSPLLMKNPDFNPEDLQRQFLLKLPKLRSIIKRLKPKKDQNVQKEDYDINMALFSDKKSKEKDGILAKIGKYFGKFGFWGGRSKKDSKDENNRETILNLIKQADKVEDVESILNQLKAVGNEPIYEFILENLKNLDKRNIRDAINQLIEKCYNSKKMKNSNDDQLLPRSRCKSQKIADKNSKEFFENKSSLRKLENNPTDSNQASEKESSEILEKLINPEDSDLILLTDVEENISDKSPEFNIEKTNSEKSISKSEIPNSLKEDEIINNNSNQASEFESNESILKEEIHHRDLDKIFVADFERNISDKLEEKDRSKEKFDNDLHIHSSKKNPKIEDKENILDKNANIEIVENITDKNLETEPEEIILNKNPKIENEKNQKVENKKNISNKNPEIEPEENALNKNPKIELEENHLNKNPNIEIVEDISDKNREIEPEEIILDENPNIELGENNPKIELEENILDKNPKIKVEENISAKNPKFEIEDNVLNKSPKIKLENNVLNKSLKIQDEGNILDKNPKIKSEENVIDKNPKIEDEENILDKNPNIDLEENIMDNKNPTIELLENISDKNPEIELEENILNKNPKIEDKKKIPDKSLRIEDEENISDKNPKIELEENILEKIPKFDVLDKSPKIEDEENISDENPKIKSEENIFDKNLKIELEGNILDQNPKIKLDDNVLAGNPKIEDQENSLYKNPNIEHEENISDKNPKIEDKENILDKNLKIGNEDNNFVKNSKIEADNNISDVKVEKGLSKDLLSKNLEPDQINSSEEITKTKIPAPEIVEEKVPETDSLPILPEIIPNIENNFNTMPQTENLPENSISNQSKLPTLLSQSDKEINDNQDQRFPDNHILEIIPKNLAEEFQDSNPNLNVDVDFVKNLGIQTIPEKYLNTGIPKIVKNVSENQIPNLSIKIKNGAELTKDASRIPEKLSQESKETSQEKISNNYSPPHFIEPIANKNEFRFPKPQQSPIEGAHNPNILGNFESENDVEFIKTLPKFDNFIPQPQAKKIQKTDIKENSSIINLEKPHAANVNSGEEIFDDINDSNNLSKEIETLKSVEEGKSSEEFLEPVTDVLTLIQPGEGRLELERPDNKLNLEKEVLKGSLEKEFPNKELYSDKEVLKVLEGSLETELPENELNPDKEELDEEVLETFNYQVIPDKKENAEMESIKSFFKSLPKFHNREKQIQPTNHEFKPDKQVLELLGESLEINRPDNKLNPEKEILEKELPDNELNPDKEDFKALDESLDKECSVNELNPDKQVLEVLEGSLEKELPNNKLNPDKEENDKLENIKSFFKSLPEFHNREQQILNHELNPDKEILDKFEESLEKEFPNNESNPNKKFMEKLEIQHPNKELNPDKEVLEGSFEKELTDNELNPDKEVLKEILEKEIPDNELNPDKKVLGGSLEELPDNELNPDKEDFEASGNQVNPDQEEHDKMENIKNFMKSLPKFHNREPQIQHETISHELNPDKEVLDKSKESMKIQYSNEELNPDKEVLGGSLEIEQPDNELIPDKEVLEGSLEKELLSNELNPDKKVLDKLKESMEIELLEDELNLDNDFLEALEIEHPDKELNPDKEALEGSLEIEHPDNGLILEKEVVEGSLEELPNNELNPDKEVLEASGNQVNPNQKEHDKMENIKNFMKSLPKFHNREPQIQHETISHELNPDKEVLDKLKESLETELPNKELNPDKEFLEALEIEHPYKELNPDKEVLEGSLEKKLVGNENLDKEILEALDNQVNLDQEEHDKMDTIKNFVESSPQFTNREPQIHNDQYFTPSTTKMNNYSFPRTIDEESLLLADENQPNPILNNQHSIEQVIKEQPPQVLGYIIPIPFSLLNKEVTNNNYSTHSGFLPPIQQNSTEKNLVDEIIEKHSTEKLPNSDHKDESTLKNFVEKIPEKQNCHKKSNSIPEESQISNNSNSLENFYSADLEFKSASNEINLSIPRNPFASGNEEKIANNDSQSLEDHQNEEELPQDPNLESSLEILNNLPKFKTSYPYPINAKKYSTDFSCNFQNSEKEQSQEKKITIPSNDEIYLWEDFFKHPTMEEDKKLQKSDEQFFKNSKFRTSNENSDFWDKFFEW